MNVAKDVDLPKVPPASEFSEAAINTFHESLLVLDGNLRILSANNSFYKDFKLNPGETVGQIIYDLGNRQWDAPWLRNLLENLLAEKPNISNHEIAHSFPIIGRRLMLVNAGRFSGSSGQEHMILLAFKDITESKRSQEMIRAIFDQSFQFIGLLDTDGVLLEANLAALEFGGIEARNVLGKPFWETPWWTHSRELQEKLRQAVRAAAGGEFVRFEVTHVARDKTLHYADFSIKPVRDASGRVVFLIPESRDITERKYMESLLKQCNERYLQIISTVTDYIYTVYVENGVAVKTTYNPACLTVTGYTPEEFFNNKFLWLTMVTEADRTMVKDWTRRILNGEKVEPLEHRIVCKDRTVRWVRNTPVLNKDENGNLISYDGIVQDITNARMEAREQVASETLNTIMEWAPNAVIVIDLKGKVARYNHAVMNSFGYGSDIIGRSVSDLIIEDDRPKISVRIRECLGKGWNKNQELTIVTKKRQTIPVLMNASLLKDAQGAPKNMVLVFTDITERKKAEEARVSFMNELRRSNADLERFASVVSHDLQEPLRMVAGFSELLKERCQKAVDKKAHEYIDFISEGARRMQVFINDVLRLARAGANRSNPPAVNTGAVLDEVLKGMKKALSESGARISAGQLPEIKFHHAELYQIFQNLISNAIKFRGNRPPLIRIAAKELEKEWEFSVSDNGIGFDQKFEKLIFDPFQRLHSRRRYEGSGIGLPICKKIVEKNGGRLMAKGTLGQGSSFCFTVPKEPATGRDAPKGN